ncbi:MAG: hypothetical protein AAGU21_02060 [Solidesulfovibrio sp.]|uniref:hypothetical protein n=1 Tax=Solidesulfovibrio sp. TaxID=2910990 RepID=UPI0031581543
MPLMSFRLVPALCLALALSACAPANKAASPTAKATKKTASSQPVPAQGASPQGAAAQGASTQGKNGFRVVMGQPLPGDTAKPAQGQATAAPQFAASAPAAGQVPFPAPAPGSDQALAPAAPAGAPTGFGGLKWGDAPHTFPGLAVHETDKAAAVTTCIWPQGPKDVFGAPIREAYYEFHKDRFYHVWLEFDGLAAYRTALEGLTRAYGPPSQEDPAKYYHAWNLGEVNVYCAYHPAENDGDVSYFYQPIYETMMAARKAQAKSAPRSRTP